MQDRPLTRNQRAWWRSTGRYSGRRQMSPMFASRSVKSVKKVHQNIPYVNSFPRRRTAHAKIPRISRLPRYVVSLVAGAGPAKLQQRDTHLKKLSNTQRLLTTNSELCKPTLFSPQEQRTGPGLPIFSPPNMWSAIRHYKDTGLHSRATELKHTLINHWS